jgi:alkylation response protein AidB-like acyl-CoA dehydrogenase
MTLAGLPSEPPELDALRREVGDWLRANHRAGRPDPGWLALVVDRGYAVPTWPRQWYGRDASPEEARIIAEEFRRAGAPGSNQDRHNLWANTLLTYGTVALKGELLRRLLLDEVRMCLLYSEPGAGSDLASLRTRAEWDGADFVVTGQKVWTSRARQADYGMLVARTNWDVPKHHGLSFFFLPMRQPGVVVRPIKQITGESLFNEVFIDAARVPAENLLGTRNDGWRVLQTALAYERSVMGDVARGPRQPGRQPATDPDVARRDPPGPGASGAEVDLVALARVTGRAADPAVRQAIARIHALRTVNRWNGQRAQAQLQQGSSSPIPSLGKLAMSRILHEGARVQALILGSEAMLTGPDQPRGDAANFLALNAFFTSIGGGTDEIQRNIIGERLLGLPREPEVDRNIPFRQVRSGG